MFGKVSAETHVGVYGHSLIRLDIAALFSLAFYGVKLLWPHPNIYFYFTTFFLLVRLSVKPKEHSFPCFFNPYLMNEKNWVRSFLLEWIWTLLTETSFRVYSRNASHTIFIKCAFFLLKFCAVRAVIWYLLSCQWRQEPIFDFVDFKTKIKYSLIPVS